MVTYRLFVKHRKQKKWPRPQILQNRHCPCSPPSDDARRFRGPAQPVRRLSHMAQTVFAIWVPTMRVLRDFHWTLSARALLLVTALAMVQLLSGFD